MSGTYVFGSFIKKITKDIKSEYIFRRSEQIMFLKLDEFHKITNTKKKIVIF